MLLQQQNSKASAEKVDVLPNFNPFQNVDRSEQSESKHRQQHVIRGTQNDPLLRSQIQQLYPKRIRKVDIYSQGQEQIGLNEGQASHNQSKVSASQQLSPSLMKRTGMFGMNMTSTDPSDAYSDKHHSNPYTFDHAELEEILAIPKDGKKQLNQHSFQRYENNDIMRSRNSLMKKMALTTAYSFGGLSFKDEYNYIHKFNARPKSIAQVTQPAPVPRINTRQASRSHQMQRLETAKGQKEATLQHSSSQKLATTTGPTATATNKKRLPLLKGSISAVTVSSQENMQKQPKSQKTYVLNESKSTQLQQCASLKLQKKLIKDNMFGSRDSSSNRKGSHNGDQDINSRAKTLQALSKLIQDENKSQKMSIPQDNAQIKIKPKSFLKIRQEKQREFGSSSELLGQDYFMQTAGTQSEVVENYSLEAYQHHLSQTTFGVTPFNQTGLSNLPDVQRKIPRMGRNTQSNIQLRVGNTRGNQGNGSSSTLGGMRTQLYSTANGQKFNVRDRLGQVVTSMTNQQNYQRHVAASVNQADQYEMRLGTAANALRPEPHILDIQQMSKKKKMLIEDGYRMAGPLAAKKRSVSREIHFGHLESIESSAGSPFARAGPPKKHKGLAQKGEPNANYFDDVPIQSTYKTTQKKLRDNKRKVSPFQKNQLSLQKPQVQLESMDTPMRLQTQQLALSSLTDQLKKIEGDFRPSFDNSADDARREARKEEKSRATVSGSDMDAVIQKLSVGGAPTSHEGFNENNQGLAQNSNQDIKEDLSMQRRSEVVQHAGELTQATKELKLQLKQQNHTEVKKGRKSEKITSSKADGSSPNKINGPEIEVTNVQASEQQTPDADSFRELRASKKPLGIKKKQKKSTRRRSLTLKDKQSFDFAKSQRRLNTNRKSKRSKEMANTNRKREHSADEAYGALRNRSNYSSDGSEPEDQSRVNIHSLSTILANNLNGEALQVLRRCLERLQQGGPNEVRKLGPEFQNIDTKEYLRQTNKLVKALRFTTNRLILSQENFHTELRQGQEHSVELVKDATIYFKVNLLEHQPPIKIQFDYFDMQSGQLLKRNQVGNIITVYLSQLNSKPKQKECQFTFTSPSVVEINGSQNAGDKTRFENPEAFIAIQAFGSKSEDIILKLKLRTHTEVSLGQSRIIKAENLKAAVEGAKRKNTMLETFGSRLLQNIGRGDKARKLIDPSEIAIQTNNIAVFKEYIQKKITGMIEDEGKFEEYQTFCRNRQEEQLRQAGALDKLKSQSNLFKGDDDSSDESDDKQRSTYRNKEQPRSKNRMQFDFDHPNAFLNRNMYIITGGKRPENFLAKNRESIAYGWQNMMRVEQLRSQYKLQTEAAVRSKRSELEREYYKRKIFLIMRYQILQDIKWQQLGEKCDKKKMKQRVKWWIQLQSVNRVIFKAKVQNFDTLVKKKQHEKYEISCKSRIWKNFNIFMMRKRYKQRERTRLLFRSITMFNGLTNIDRAQSEARQIILELLQKNYEIECQIQRLLRFRRILRLVQKRFKMRKKQEDKRRNQIGQEWQKKISDKVQEKLKSKQKAAKNKDLVKRWVEFQDVTRQKTYIFEKAKELFDYQKMRFQLKDCVVLIVETNRKYDKSMQLGQVALADKYAKRIQKYQERLYKLIEHLDEAKLRLGVKMKTEKVGNNKKKNASNQSDWNNVKKKLTNYGIHDAYMKSSLVDDVLTSVVDLVPEKEQDQAAKDPFEQDEIHSLEKEFKFPKYVRINFQWIPSDQVISDTVDFAFQQYDKEMKDNTKTVKAAKPDSANNQQNNGASTELNENSIQEQTQDETAM